MTDLRLSPIAGNVKSIQVCKGLSLSAIPDNGVLILDPCVLPLLGKDLLSKFREIIQVEGGENGKTEERFLSLLLQHREALEQSDCLVAIGGGGTLNMATSIAHAMASAGHAPPYHIVPTTLLAMVDVAYGSLGRLNRNGLKNKIRCAYDPTAIILDPVFLRHLPVAEIKRGLAECLKHALLQSTPDNKDRFPTVEECLFLLKKEHPSVENVFPVAEKTLNAKAAVITAINEGNKLIENILSYGHVDAEPREGASGLRLSHGDAVLLGLAIEAALCGPAKMDETIIEVIPYTPLGKELNLIDFDSDVMREAYRSSGKPRFSLGADRYRVVRLSTAGQFASLNKETNVDFMEFDFKTLFDAGCRIIRHSTMSAKSFANQ